VDDLDQSFDIGRTSQTSTDHYNPSNFVPMENTSAQLEVPKFNGYQVRARRVLRPPNGVGPVNVSRKPAVGCAATAEIIGARKSCS